ncbi:hypothetical protein BOC41_13635 [Burkholderia pseudomallei]|nr:hypothetical protein BOC41_13635 [Burkholderia pseudomallei]
MLRGHGRLQHHAIKKQKPPTWRGFVSNLSPGAPPGLFAFMTATPRRRAARRPLICSAAASGAGTDARP